jgi:hypothetical protein
MSNTFLKPDEIKQLTGRTKIALQIAQLAKMGIPFFVNAVGRPIVTRSAIEGRSGTQPAPTKKAWVPRVLQAG